MRDVQFLHNEQFFAAAQRKYVYVYDKRGLEVHCLKVRVQELHFELTTGNGWCPSAPLRSMIVSACCLVGRQEHTGVWRLEFLPYHFLLSSIGEGGVLRYQARPCCVALRRSGPSDPALSSAVDPVSAVAEHCCLRIDALLLDLRCGELCQDIQHIRFTALSTRTSALARKGLWRRTRAQGRWWRSTGRGWAAAT